MLAYSAIDAVLSDVVINRAIPSDNFWLELIFENIGNARPIPDQCAGLAR